MKRLLFIFLLPLVTHCAAPRMDQPQRIILKHPETYDFQSCEAIKWKPEEAQNELDECVEKYKQLGYEIWGQR